MNVPKHPEILACLCFFSDTMRTPQKPQLLVVTLLLLLLEYFGPRLVVQTLQANEYTRCEWDTNIKWGSCPAPSWDPACLRIHGTQFGCYLAICSLENEANFLGLHAEENGQFLVDPNWIEIAHDFFRMSIREPSSAGISNKYGFTDPDAIFKKYTEPPKYVDINSLPSPISFIPQICDFRGFLYCDTTLDADPLGSRCQCHPLYSSKAPGKPYACRGRAGVPCGYNQGDTLLNYPGELSKCAENLACEVMNQGELADFKAGKIWKGFGYSPIIVRYVLEQATHICKCKRKDYTRNSMHGCSTV